MLRPQTNERSQHNVRTRASLNLFFTACYSLKYKRAPAGCRAGTVTWDMLLFRKPQRKSSVRNYSVVRLQAGGVRGWWGRSCRCRLKENEMQTDLVAHNESRFCSTQAGQCTMVPRGGTLFFLLLLAAEALGEQQCNDLTAHLRNVKCFYSPSILGTKGGEMPGNKPDLKLMKKLVKVL